MTHKISDLTGFQRDLLYALTAYHQPSGQTVREELEEYLGRDVTHGQLYPNLDTLVEAGLVEKGDIDRRTNYYDISDQGEKAIRRRREWENTHLEFID